MAVPRAVDLLLALLVWLENSCAQSFVRHDIEIDLPPLTVSLEVAGLDGDGLPDPRYAQQPPR